MKKLSTFILLFVLTALTTLRAAENYSSVPKGITLEGTARGITTISSIKYNKSQKSFILNDHLTLKNPIKDKEFAYLITTLRHDSQFGISVIGGRKAIYYGAWSKKGDGRSIAQKLYAADEFFRGVVFGIPRLYNMYRLPGNYKPVKPRLREYYTAVWFNLRRFRYTLNDTNYKYSGCNIQVKLLAVKDISDEQAPDGGYALDPEGITHEEDRENVANIKQHAKGYLNLKIARPMIEYGKAAALIRYFISQGVDLDRLHSQLK